MVDLSRRVAHAHPGRPTVPIVLTDAEREQLQELLRRGTLPRREYERAQMLWWLAQGVPTTFIAAGLGVAVQTVQRWSTRLRTGEPLTKLADARRTGRPRALSPGRPLPEWSPKRVVRRAKWECR